MKGMSDATMGTVHANVTLDNPWEKKEKEKGGSSRSLAPQVVRKPIPKKKGMFASLRVAHICEFSRRLAGLRIMCVRDTLPEWVEHHGDQPDTCFSDPVQSKPQIETATGGSTIQTCQAHRRP